MFSIGDTVVYKNEGVCVVSDICEKEFNGSTSEYYLLAPVYKPTATIYIPLDNKVLTSRIKRILSADETNDTINRSDDYTAVWLDNPEERRELYKQLQSDIDRAPLLRTLMLIRERQENKDRAVKKPHVFDLQFLRESEKSLCEQFAYSLGIEPDEVPAYIERMREEKSAV